MGMSRARVEDIAPRLLFSADAAVLVPEPALISAPEPITETARPYEAAAPDAQRSGRELVVVDTSIADHEQLVADFQAQQDAGREFIFLLIEPGEDGLQAIEQAVQQPTAPFDAIHIVSHGDNGAFRLGSTLVDPGVLAERASVISQWGAGLGADADILIYGCDLAASDSGRALMDDIALLTGADVAASDDPTGSAAAGGDWQLEAQTGSIETVALSSSWAGTLDLVATSGDTPVNNTGGGSHITDPASSGQVATNGTYSAVVWDNGGKINLRLYGPNGDTGTVQVATGGAQPAVAMSANDDVVITWVDTGGSDEIMAVTLSAAAIDPGSGTSIALAPFQVNQETDTVSKDPAVAIADDGSFLISWVQQYDNAPFSLDIAYRLFDGSGTPTGPVDTAIALDPLIDVDAAFDDQGLPRVTWDASNDRFGILWMEFTPSGPTINFRGVEGMTGTTPGARFAEQALIAGPATAGLVTQADIAARSDGLVSLAIVHESSPGSNLYEISYATADLFAATGGASGTLTTVN
ncbi:MAG: DUF4347 domain-containing protein [Burkholderiaceae bacterium]